VYCTFRIIRKYINGNEVAVTYRSAPCNGVKAFSEDDCSYVASIREQKPCQRHAGKPLYKTNDVEPCPVQFAYVFPDDPVGGYLAL